MKYEIILLTAFDTLTGKTYGFPETEDTLKVKGTYQGKDVWITYEDTGETKYQSGKPRRIFNLTKIEQQT